MEALTVQKCVPCEGNLDALTRDQFGRYLDQVPNWEVVDKDSKLEREFCFEDFRAALQFVNAAGEVAEEGGHHPNMYLHDWNKVKMIVYTHAIGGLSLNDFVMASKIDAIDLTKAP